MNVNTATLPRTIQALISEVSEIDGDVVFTSPTRFEVSLPCRMVGGAVRLVGRGSVGWYVRDGKNVISGVAAMRREISYWGRQSGHAAR